MWRWIGVLICFPLACYMLLKCRKSNLVGRLEWGQTDSGNVRPKRVWCMYTAYVRHLFSWLSSFQLTKQTWCFVFPACTGEAERSVVLAPLSFVLLFFTFSAVTVYCFRDVYRRDCSVYVRFSYLFSYRRIRRYCSDSIRKCSVLQALLILRSF
jgi:hypothetical protein